MAHMSLVSDPRNRKSETSSRKMIFISVLFLIVFQPSQPFTFPTNEEEANPGPFLEPVPETRDYDTENNRMVWPVCKTKREN